MPGERVIATGEIGMWDAGVDYLRLTHRKDASSYEVANKYARAVQTIGRDGADSQAEEVDWSFRGYRGIRLGAAAWGERPEGFILQVSGVSAQQAFEMDLPFTHVPRVDVQVTLWLLEENAGVAEEVARLASAHRPRNKGRRAKVRYINGYGDGDTAYIGTRGKKSKFLRCYDKWKESGGNEGYDFAWRFEVELTDAHALLAYLSLRDLPAGRYSAMATVAGYYEERGVCLPKLDGIPQIAPEKIPRDLGSEERRLKWLQSGVAPSLRKMVDRGTELSTIIEALGLTRDDVLRAYLQPKNVRAKMRLGPEETSD